MIKNLFISTFLLSAACQDSSKVKTPLNTESTKPNSKSEALANQILGAWTLTGMESPSFIIGRGMINYPETFAAYKYTIEGDSIIIKYDDYTASFFVKMNGTDTLMLKSDTQLIYYRVQVEK
jgi:hypothetical protein